MAFTTRQVPDQRRPSKPAAKQVRVGSGRSCLQSPLQFFFSLPRNDCFSKLAYRDCFVLHVVAVVLAWRTSRHSVTVYKYCQVEKLPACREWNRFIARRRLFLFLPVLVQMVLHLHNVSLFPQHCISCKVLVSFVSVVVAFFFIR